jgi:ATP-dependent protease ClpP protease subunit
VNPTTAEALLAAAAQIANAGVKELYLLLSTPGGSVMNGMNVYNVLKGLPLKVITHNVGNVDSIGNVIFLAGKERYACANATFMFHGVAAGIPQGQLRMEQKDLRERLDSVEHDNARIAAIIASSTTFANNAEIEALFLEAKTKNPTYAKSKGIIHDVREVQIPPGAPVQQLVFQR